MRKRSFFKNRLFIVTAVVDIILIVSVFFLMNYVRYLLNEDVRINLTEIVTQNKDVISSKIALELGNLETEAMRLSDRIVDKKATTDDELEAVFMEYVRQQSGRRLVWAPPSGKAVSESGKRADISGRTYFRLGMQGIVKVSDRLISKIDGEDSFVISVPVTVEGKIIGTLQRQYSPQAMYELCSVSLFSEQGSTYIINSDGYILICSQNSVYSRESDNYYRIIYLTDAETSKRLEADIRAHKSGFMEAVVDGEKIFFAYTPVEQIHDWYLISSIATDAVSPNGMAVVRIFYYILTAILLIFSCSMFYYWLLKRKQQLSLERVAFVDTVTGGSSYTKFTVDMQEALATNPQQQYALCAFDIDNFKYINSIYGFETGDSILRELVSRYSAKLRQGERIARISGDHFVMLLLDATAQRMAELIDAEMTLNDIKLYLSVGVYHITDPHESINLMLDKASTAAQMVKGKLFKHIEWYSESFDREAAHNEELKRAVEIALEHHEIIPFFQPKVNIDTGELIGAEALARWRRNDGTLVSPAEFIPICEQTGIIAPVDMAIFEQTLRFIRQNLDSGVRCVPISVNFSRMHLLNESFLSTLLGKMVEYRVPPELIELELTETVIFDNHDTINDFINELHENGLKMSMDDFGSGFSSLHMLKDVDIDVLKIDRGFLLDTTNNMRQRTIFGAIVSMAEKLQIKVVVEGVETIENVNLMREFGCTYAQGYYYSRPLDSERFEKLYREGHLCQD